MTPARDFLDQFHDEVHWLLEEKYGWSRQQVREAIQQSQSSDALLFSAEIQADFDQLSLGVPVAYLIGWVEFLGCHIDLRYRPLVPRPETEYWVEQFLKSRKKSLADKQMKVLDLCCGSGCIAAAVLKHWPEAEVDAVDIADAAVRQTTHNLELLAVARGRWKVIQSDLFTSVGERYDFILCNPPYVDIFGSFSDNIKHEPELALFAQNKGISLIEQVILKCEKHLVEFGELWLEFGEGQADEVIKLGQQVGLTVVTYPDQFDRQRYAVITKSTSHPQS
jgi:release factor glutamine methyltransferase